MDFYILNLFNLVKRILRKGNYKCMEHLSKREKIIIMTAIASSLLFASLNQTIISNILPRIASQLAGMELFNWVFTIYMLTSSITAILVGKLSDQFGRKNFILGGIAIFLIGTFLCGTSTSIYQLIIYRGIQGFGGGMVISTSFAAVGDLFSPRERGRWQGFLSATFATSNILGPSIGGYIIDHFHWQYCFWIFLPVGIIAFILIAFLFPKTAKKENKAIDYLGSVFLSTTIIPLLLAFSWAGKDYSWSSLPIIGLLVGSLFSLLIFLYAEKKAQNPVLPLHLFQNAIFSLSNIVNLLLGIGMFSAIMFTPFFLQGVLQYNATKSSLMMMPLSLGLVFASFISGQMMSRTGKYKKLSIFGLSLMTIGMYSMYSIDSTTDAQSMFFHLLAIGCGLGSVFPIFSITIQNAVSYEHLGVATSSVQLFRQLGGTIGVSIMGTIFQTSMKTELATQGSSINPQIHQAMNQPTISEQVAQLQDTQVLMNPDQLAQLKHAFPSDLQNVFDLLLNQLREALSISVNHVFLTTSIFLTIALLVGLFIKEIPLRTSNHMPNKQKDSLNKTATQLATGNSR